VLITDGEASLSPETITICRELTRKEGVSWLVIGVGADAAEVCSCGLADIATELVVVRHTDGDDDLVATVTKLKGCDTQ
jgi:hypothetical protein